MLEDVELFFHHQDRAVSFGHCFLRSANFILETRELTSVLANFGLLSLLDLVELFNFGSKIA
jgi:hypothetical protein